MQRLLEPLQLGELNLPHRIAMSAMTRNRSPGETPNAMNALYYAQRASAAFIVSESTAISQEGLGWPGTPGIFTAQQVAGWRGVTDAVHARGGYIFLQMWHCGAASHPVTRGGELPLAPSPITLAGTVRTPQGRVPLAGSRAMTTAEIARTVADYGTAARHAMDAGFDGVEVHGANGYLIDQFLRDGSNRRDDAYGGSARNRCRLLFEVVAEVCKVWSPGQVGVRLSPASPSNYELRDSDPAHTARTALQGLGKLGIAYVVMVEGSSNTMPPTHEIDYAALRPHFTGLYIANNGFTRESGEAALQSGRADLIAYGRPFIANPDLPRRFALGAPLNELDKDTLYLPDERGYTDYPFLNPDAPGPQGDIA